ncbi:MAG: SRPBCC domain-containing protein [Steroidobacteraceae bacterium]
MPERPRGYAARIDLLATRSRVWQALTDPQLLKQWYAQEARVAARLNGGYWVRLGPKFEREAHIDVFDVERRLRLIYMQPPGLPEGESAIVEDFLLDDEGGGTVLRVLGSGVPGAPEWNMLFMLLKTGWERALPRLKIAVERRDKDIRGEAPAR